jgi:hypothetical protein
MGKIKKQMDGISSSQQCLTIVDAPYQVFSLRDKIIWNVSIEFFSIPLHQGC